MIRLLISEKRQSDEKFLTLSSSALPLYLQPELCLPELKVSAPPQHLDSHLLRKLKSSVPPLPPTSEAPLFRIISISLSSLEGLPWPSCPCSHHVIFCLVSPTLHELDTCISHVLTHPSHSLPRCRASHSTPCQGHQWTFTANNPSAGRSGHLS